MRTKIIPIYSETLPNGVTIQLKNVKVDLWKIDGKWEEAWPASECRRMERAVEKVLPGWYHRFNKDGTHKKNCISCKRYGEMGYKR